MLAGYMLGFVPATAKRLQYIHEHKEKKKNELSDQWNRFQASSTPTIAPKEAADYTKTC